MMDFEHRPDNDRIASMPLEEFKRKAILLPVEEIAKQRRA